MYFFKKIANSRIYYLLVVLNVVSMSIFHVMTLDLVKPVGVKSTLDFIFNHGKEATYALISGMVSAALIVVIFMAMISSVWEIISSYETEGKAIRIVIKIALAVVLLICNIVFVKELIFLILVPIALFAVVYFLFSDQ